MAVNAAQSGSWRRFRAATMVLATALVVAACSSGVDDNTAAPAEDGSHSMHAGGSSAPPQPLRAGERFVELRMAEAYTPEPPEGAVDEYRCQVLDPGLTEEAFLTGTQVMPENVAIAHHGIVYAVPPGDAAAVREQDARTPGLGWQCFGGTGVEGAEGDYPAIVPMRVMRNTSRTSADPRTVSFFSGARSPSSAARMSFTAL